jgi:hypothetical protein
MPYNRHAPRWCVTPGLFNRSPQHQLLGALRLDVDSNTGQHNIGRVGPALVLHAAACITPEQRTEFGSGFTFTTLALLSAHAAHASSSIGCSM